MHTGGGRRMPPDDGRKNTNAKRVTNVNCDNSRKTQS